MAIWSSICIDLQRVYFHSDCSSARTTTTTSCIMHISATPWSPNRVTSSCLKSCRRVVRFPDRVSYPFVSYWHIDPRVQLNRMVSLTHLFFAHNTLGWEHMAAMNPLGEMVAGEPHHDAAFERFKSRHDVRYESSGHEDFRKSVFKNNVRCCSGLLRSTYHLSASAALFNCTTVLYCIVHVQYMHSI